MKNPPLILLLFFQAALSAQTIIVFNNPSFEDTPRSSTAPKGWIPCGMEGETASDIQPGQFNCTASPAEGKSYIGSKHLLIVSDAMRQFPDKKLVLRLKTNSSRIYKKRAAFLEKYLLALGLPRRQFDVSVDTRHDRYAWKISSPWLEAWW